MFWLQGKAAGGGLDLSAMASMLGGGAGKIVTPPSSCPAPAPVRPTNTKAQFNNSITFSNFQISDQNQPNDQILTKPASLANSRTNMSTRTKLLIEPVY